MELGLSHCPSEHDYNDTAPTEYLHKLSHKHTKIKNSSSIGCNNLFLDNG